METDPDSETLCPSENWMMDKVQKPSNPKSKHWHFCLILWPLVCMITIVAVTSALIDCCFKNYDTSGGFHQNFWEFCVNCEKLLRKLSCFSLGRWGNLKLRGSSIQTCTSPVYMMSLIVYKHKGIECQVCLSTRWFQSTIYISGPSSKFALVPGMPKAKHVWAPSNCRSGVRLNHLILWPEMALWYHPLMMNKYGALVEWQLAGEKPMFLFIKTCPIITFIVPVWHNIQSNLNLIKYFQKFMENNLSM
jgi:hypothetical protein